MIILEKIINRSQQTKRLSLSVLFGGACGLFEAVLRTAKDMGTINQNNMGRSG